MGRPTRAWSADRTGRHLSDDVLSFRMSRRQTTLFRIAAHSTASPYPLRAPVTVCRWQRA
jgi:hypothetical protein